MLCVVEILDTYNQSSRDFVDCIWILFHTRRSMKSFCMKKNTGYPVKYTFHVFPCIVLTHWGRVMHIGVGNLAITDSDNSLSPSWCQAIIWTNAGVLLIWHIGTNFSEISIKIHAFSFKKMYLKRSSAKWWPFRLGLNVLICNNRFNSYDTMVISLVLGQSNKRLYVFWYSHSYVFCSKILTKCIL